MLKRIGLISTLLALACLAGAQDLVVRSTAGEKSVRISKIAAKIHVDGKLDEPVWETAAPISDFVQTDPNQGAPVSEKTEVRIFYDDANIYFGFRCYDSEPEKIVARLGAHDGRTNSDSVNILIDTFRDSRTGYYFSINSRGIQFDAVTNESKGSGWSMHDSSWDGIWHSAASLESWGYSVEVVIPFKSIRLARADEQVWGLNLSRDIVRKNETASWVPVSRFDGTMKPSAAGTLTGLEDIRLGRNLEVIPFLSGSYRRSNWRPELNGLASNGGVDVRYGLTANLTASMTVNPDFADTEADEFTSELFRTVLPRKAQVLYRGCKLLRHADGRGVLASCWRAPTRRRTPAHS